MQAGASAEPRAGQPCPARHTPRLKQAGLAFVDLRFWSPGHSLGIPLNSPTPAPFQRCLLPGAHRVRAVRRLDRDLTQANIPQLVLAAGCPEGSIPAGSRRACGLCPGNITFRKEKIGLLSAKLQIIGTLGMRRGPTK